ncbi:Hypothetical predicted protein, partial [Scomber scombrus]
MHPPTDECTAAAPIINIYSSAGGFFSSPFSSPTFQRITEITEEELQEEKKKKTTTKLKIIPKVS